MKKLFTLFLLLQAVYFAEAQPLLKSAASYRLFFGTTPTLYDTVALDYQTGKSYNTAGQYWEYDSLHQFQTTPAGNAFYTQYQTYNGNGSLASHGKMTAPGASSFSATRNSFTYNAAGKILLNLEETTTSPTLSSWNNSLRTKYYYNSNNDLDSITAENYTGSTWYLNAKDVYTYSSPGHVAYHNRYYSSFLFAGPFDPEYYFRAFYNTSGQLQIDSTWKKVSNNWVFYNTVSYQYNSSGDLVHTTRTGTQSVNSNFYTLGENIDITYNSNHQKLQESSTALYQDMVTRNYVQKTWAYNANGFPDTYTQKSWDDAHQQWAIQQWGSNTITPSPDEIVHYYYGFPTGVAQVCSTIGFNIFPNPATRDFTVKTEGTGATYKMVFVRDIYGRVVVKQDINTAGNTNVNIADLAKGTYYVQLVGENTSTVARTLSVL